MAFLTQRIEAATSLVGKIPVQRALPTAKRRHIGAWCFLDHFGPADTSVTRGMRVGPHPHIGLQTVTWLLQGELLHRDSLGTLQAIVPGQLNLMTAGKGISHSEESPTPRSPGLHGVQFWVALPDAARHMAPAFAHHPQVPSARLGGITVTIFAGEWLGERSPAEFHTPLMGANLEVPSGTVKVLPLRADFEYGAICTHGEVKLRGKTVTPGMILYMANGREGLPIATGASDAGVVLVGGMPFEEAPLMWWNFVARTKDELAQASRDWNAGAAYFGEVKGYDGDRLAAPLPPWA